MSITRPMDRQGEVVAWRTDEGDFYTNLDTLLLEIENRAKRKKHLAYEPYAVDWMRHVFKKVDFLYCPATAAFYLPTENIPGNVRVLGLLPIYKWVANEY